jgi:hypothetical protein
VNKDIVDIALAEDRLFAKMVVLREGASLRTADELRERFVFDAMDLLGVDVAGYGGEDDPDSLDENVCEYERALGDAGYTVAWEDGFVIYKDLTEDEIEYLANV